MSALNYKFQTANLRYFFSGSLFLCAFCVFAINSFAQTSNLTQKQIDWLAAESFLMRTIQTGNEEQKRDALFQIRNLETETASRLAIPALRDKSEIVRATAAFSVVYLPEEESLQVLLPLLNDKKELVRREAAYALGKVRNPNAVNSLIQTFQKDKIIEVKNACVIALGEIGDAAAIDFLRRILQLNPKNSNDFLHRSAARSIGQIAQIIQTGKVEVLTPEDFLPESFHQIQKPKFKILNETFPAFRSVIPALIQVLQSNNESDDTRREAAFALGAIGDETAVPVLQSKLNAKDYYLAQIARESLRKIAAYAEFAKSNQ